MTAYQRTARDVVASKKDHWQTSCRTKLANERPQALFAEQVIRIEENDPFPGSKGGANILCTGSPSVLHVTNEPYQTFLQLLPELKSQQMERIIGRVVVNYYDFYVGEFS